MGILDGLKRTFTEETEETYGRVENYDLETNEGEEVINSEEVDIQNALAGKSAGIIMREPKSYAEAKTIADYLLENRAVVVNLQKLTPDVARRIVDFLQGTIYALDGDIKKVASNTFLCTPNSIGSAGKIQVDEVVEEEAKRF